MDQAQDQAQDHAFDPASHPYSIRRFARQHQPGETPPAGLYNIQLLLRRQQEERSVEEMETEMLPAFRLADLPSELSRVTSALRYEHLLSHIRRGVHNFFGEFRLLPSTIHLPLGARGKLIDPFTYWASEFGGSIAIPLAYSAALHPSQVKCLL